MARKSVLICRIAAPPRDQVRAVTERAIRNGGVSAGDIAAIEAGLNVGSKFVATFDAGALMRIQRAAGAK